MKNQRIFTNEELQLIRTSFYSYVSARLLADQLGCSVRSIFKRYRDLKQGVELKVLREMPRPRVRELDFKFRGPPTAVSEWTTDENGVRTREIGGM
jgi:hypothetical protein